MKDAMNYIKISITTLAMFALISNVIAGAYGTTSKKIKTIILIEGQPYLVELSKDGSIVTQFGLVENYMITDISHEEFVQQMIVNNSHNNIIENVKYISFESLTPEINEEIVDYLSDLVMKVEQSIDSRVIIYANQMYESDQLAKYIKELMTDFGLNEDQIEIKKNIVIQGGMFKTIKVEYVPQLENT